MRHPSLRAFFFLLAFTYTSIADSFQARVAQAIEAAGLTKEEVSIVITPLQGDGVSYRLYPQKVRVPASVMKIPTVYANLRYFGMRYRIPTKFYRIDTIKNGTLQGDLYVRGYGDPSLESGDLDRIVSQIKQAGIERIEGDIVIDRSFFKVDKANSSRFDKNLYSPYNAMPDAMMFNARVSTLCIDPKTMRAYDAVGDESYRVVDRLRYSNDACKGRFAWPRVIIKEEGARSVVYLEGILSRHCPKRKICKVLTRPYLSFYYAFKKALSEAGIAHKGKLRLQKIPPDARLLFIYRGDPMQKIFARTLKKSDNLYARQLMLFLGGADAGRPATLAKGRDAVMTQLRLAGIAIRREDFFIDNGSGLSRKAKVTARALEAILDDAYRRYGQKWLRLLSIAGVDGTIKRRFRNGSAKNKAWMKTGTLRHVKNIAGYVADGNGRLHIVVVLVNSKKGNWRGAQLQNDLINTIAAWR